MNNKLLLEKLESVHEAMKHVTKSRALGVVQRKLNAFTVCLAKELSDGEGTEAL